MRDSNHSRARKTYTKPMRFTNVNDKGSSVAIKVMDIDPEPLVLNGHNYYLVKHERGSYGFEAKSDELKTVLELKAKLPETQRMHPKRLIFI